MGGEGLTENDLAEQLSDRQAVFSICSPSTTNQLARETVRFHQLFWLETVRNHLTRPRRSETHSVSEGAEGHRAWQIAKHWYRGQYAGCGMLHTALAAPGV
jgi:hypothetical protein